MTIKQLLEEQDKEFDKLLLEEGIPSKNDDLYGEGSISEWLKQNDDKHLYSTEVYGEPMLDLDAEKVKHFLSQSSLVLIEHIKKMVEEKKRELHPIGVQALDDIINNLEVK